jgi:serine/threonine protein kinase
MTAQTKKTPQKQLGRYRVIAEVGRGAMGIVYKAEDPVLDRPLAIKTIFFPADETDRQEYEARFNQEARAAGRLAHPGIVTIYDVGREGEMLFMAMELLEGIDLSARAKERRFSVPETIEITAQVAEALAFAHDRGVVHRDIKPPNIMIIDNDRVKLMDFGIARIRQSDLKTETGVMLGTPRYMSPEQVSGRPVDHRSDIFSLGTVIYEMLTASKLYSGSDPSEIVYNVVNFRPVPPSYINRQVPPMLDLVLAKALEKDPDARYQDAHQLALDLRSCLTEMRVPERGAESTMRIESTMRVESKLRTERVATAEDEGVDGEATTQRDTDQDHADEPTQIEPMIAKSQLRVAAVIVDATTRLPVSRSFACETALKRLTNPTQKDHARLVRAPRPQGLFMRTLRDQEFRMLLVTILIAITVAALMATY